MKKFFIVIISLISLQLLQSCKEEKKEISSTTLPTPDKNNGDISLPKNFGALVVHNGLGKMARHITVRDNGDIYVKMLKKVDNNGIIAFRDTTGNGKSDIEKEFGNFSGSGIDINNGYLYASSTTEVYRYALKKDNLLPNLEPELVISGFPKQNDHSSKPFTFDDNGNIYVTVGSPSNACQKEARSPGKKGMDPCPHLDLQAGIWSFKTNKTKQIHGKDGFKYATGIRNAMGLDWNFTTNSLYAMQHGRDQLHQLWPDLYTKEQNAQLPAEEFLQVNKGDDFGWPYCYFDQNENKKMLAPEYGGNGTQQGRCEGVKPPIMAFPGHLAPNDLLFYTGNQFPERYKNGAFIVFHGSWNRSPLPQKGFFVAFVPMKDGKPSGEWEIFADNFAGMEEVKNPADAINRPMGIAQGPDGSLYITSSATGKIWRVMYYGENSNVKETVIIYKEPVIETATNETDNPNGKKVYDTYCLACHQANGKGVSGLNPPLVNTDWVKGDKKALIGVLLNGMAGEKVDGEVYSNVMAAHDFLTDKQIANVLTYVRSNFGNDYSSIAKEEVEKLRANK
ncbi:PQQ-dependent sugar dehydrogenase [uncultured Maribacter sp.]|uniref:PQQ-dependent sugar dehydrogenase n=1 Tax=uncultured Maribacter sp. TaxID=431308 RepID=UPI0026054E01|nr:PQQ-dependent sugar dehydrogenase [uncultured Maribacter sp.]